MRLNLLTALLVTLAATLAYRRLPELTHELTRDWTRWQMDMVLTSAMVGVGVVFGSVCVVVLLGNFVLYELPANRRRKGKT